MQAKETAAASLGARTIPSNYEVAVELDRLADEVEGGERQVRLREMRETALTVMRTLEVFSPRLIGSVWRGTARRGSDIDIVALSTSPDEIASALSRYRITEKGEVTFKERMHTYHIKLDIPPHEVEVVVRDPAEYEAEKCDIYGDVKKGLTLPELERLLRVDPLRRFVPRRGVR